MLTKRYIVLKWRVREVFLVLPSLMKISLTLVANNVGLGLC